MTLPMPALAPEPPHTAEERATLTTFLDYQRGVTLRKAAGPSAGSSST